MDNYLTLVREDGTEELCVILFTHHSEELDKDYVVFQPEGSEEVSAAVYVQNGTDGQLFPIETDEEWEMIEDLLDAFLEDYADKHEHDHEHGCGCGHEGGCGEDCDCDHDEEEACDDEECECHSR